MIYPSQKLAMGGVSIALDDPLADPFVHPAKGMRLTGSRIFGSPTYYTISDNDGSGRTLPLGGMFTGGSWFGGLALSLQQIESADPDGVFFVPQTGSWSQQPLSAQTANNTYVWAMAGRQITDDVAVAGSFQYADLNAVDGVDLLYALSQNIDQFGHMADMRAGVFSESDDGRTAELLIVHNRFDVQHDVTYLDWFFDPATNSSGMRTRLEQNQDRTNTWGMHLGYAQPLQQSGWRVGGILTANWKSHPKIPNYEIMNIPRDPGNSWAYNFGVGVSKTEGPATFGIDLIYEPIWSNTWAEADSAIALPGGGTLARGAKTVENDFRFSNALVRMGVGRETERWGLQLGLQVRSISYDLDQFNAVQVSRREQHESWMEWTPSWGASLGFPEFEVRYLGRMTTGTGRPSVAWSGARTEALDMAVASNFIVAPSAPLTLQDAQVMTHQISISLPIR
jgi:hypothetical protein